MPEFDFEIGIAFGPQTTLGTWDDPVSGAINLDDGLILGDRASGAKESGIDFSTARILREKPDLGSSFTRQASDFRREGVDTFRFSFPLAGNRLTVGATPLDSEFEHQQGIKALLAACGLVGIADASGVGFRYTPTKISGNEASASLWSSGSKYQIKDIVGSLEIVFTPGDIAIATATLTGLVDDLVPEAFPTLDFEEQATISAPSVEEVAHSWGIGAVARGFQELTIRIDNNLTDFGDANAEGGFRKRQGRRTIGATGIIIGDSADIDFERNELVRTSAPTDDLTFQVGAVTPASSSAVAYKVEIFNPEVLNLRNQEQGEVHTSAVELAATQVSGSEDDEFRLTFN